MSSHNLVRVEKPFPDGTGHFYDEAWWPFLAAHARRAPTVLGARDALATAFDDQFLKAQTFHSHPIGYQSLWRYGRWSILRLGTALSIFGVSPDTQSRLIAPDLYEAAAAELDVGLWLAASCCAVRHEPCAPLTGPDFFATPQRTKLGWEVKQQPQRSQFLQGVELVATDLSRRMSGFAAQISTAQVSGWSLELSVADSRLIKASSDAAAKSALVVALQGATIQFAARPRAGRTQVAPGIAFNAQRNGALGVQISGPVFVGDASYEGDRFQRLHLSKAAAQLEAGGVPGFVVLARDHSGLVGNYCSSLVKAVRDEPKRFASVLGIVIYDLEVDTNHQLRTKAHICLRSEARSLLSELSVLGRHGRVTQSLF